VCDSTSYKNFTNYIEIQLNDNKNANGITDMRVIMRESAKNVLLNASPANIANDFKNE
jgi:hypothetical protein